MSLKDFWNTWVYEYGLKKTLLSDNGKQFTSKLFQSLCPLLEITNVFTSPYHPQTNGELELYNRILTAMLRCYFNDRQQVWDAYASTLNYAYSSQVHRSINTRPF